MTNRHPTFVCIAVFGPLRILVDAGPGRDSDLFLVAVKPDNYEDRHVYFGPICARIGRLYLQKRGN